MTITPLEPGKRLQLPPEWTKALGIDRLVNVVPTDQDILIRPCPPATRDDFFATKLPIGSAPADDDEKDLEVTGDDLLF